MIVDGEATDKADQRDSTPKLESRDGSFPLTFAYTFIRRC